MIYVAWIVIAAAVAGVTIVAALRLARAVKRENNRIDHVIANADEIIAADREAEFDNDGSHGEMRAGGNAAEA